MKKLTLFAISIFCFIFFSQAQITKGSVLLGGGISGSTFDEDNTAVVSASSNFSFHPAFGIAVKDNVVVGMRLSYYHSVSKQSSPNYSTELEQNGYGAGVFYRRYLNLSRKFFLFGEGVGSYTKNIYENKQASSTAKQTNHTASLSLFPGVAYAVSRRFHLEVGLNDLAQLSYTRRITENTSAGGSITTKGSGFGFSSNVSTSAPLNIGFRVVLGK